MKLLTSLSACLLALSATTLALPSALISERASSNSNTTSDADGDALGNVQIFATGGTISGGSPDPTDVLNYKSGAYTISELVDDIPALSNVSSHIKAVQYANVDSGAINTTFVLHLAREIQASLRGNSSSDSSSQNLSGAVVTHGTDTLEETAFLLELTVNAGNKPVVVTAAMRPKSSISSDGEFNLLQAVSLAASPQGKGRGTVVVLNDRIGSAYYSTKTNPRSLDTFKSPEAGFLGTFEGTKPHFWYAAARPGYLSKNSKFDLSQIGDALPKVTILYAYQEMDIALLEAAVQAGSKGIVIAGIGNGGFAPQWADRVQELVSSDVPIVVSTRTGAGTVANSGETVVGAGSLNPQKAKILLQLVLATTDKDAGKVAAVKKAFEDA